MHDSFAVSGSIAPRKRRARSFVGWCDARQSSALLAFWHQMLIVQREVIWEASHHHNDFNMIVEILFAYNCYYGKN